jgi:type III pantothenate kinase
MSSTQCTIAFDIGNTRTKCALIEADGVRMAFSALTEPTETLAGRLEVAHGAAGVELPGQARCVASSVHPAANDGVRRFWQSTTGDAVEFFGPDLPVPITLEVEEPEKAGTDRVLCALGARELAGAPCIVVMAGTAITVDLVDGAGRFAGGAIAPGFGLCARAMHEGAACLPLIQPRRPAEMPGRNTVDAMQSGIYHFCHGGVRALVEKLAAVAGDYPRVVVTGGDAERLLPLEIRREVRHVPALIFEGMRAALERSGV